MEIKVENKVKSYTADKKVILNEKLEKKTAEEKPFDSQKKRDVNQTLGKVIKPVEKQEKKEEKTNEKSKEFVKKEKNIPEKNENFIPPNFIRAPEKNEDSYKTKPKEKSKKKS